MARCGFRLVLIPVFFFLWPAPALAQASLAIEADKLQFAANGQIQAEGNVTLSYLDIILRADALTADRNKVQAYGHVRLVSKTAALTADRLEIDLRSRALAAENLKGRMGEFFLHGASLQTDGRGGEVLTGAGLTRCDLERPCYELQAARITIHGRKVTVERGWLVVKGFRVLPLPRLVLDLDRLAEWPLLDLGYGADGLQLGMAMTWPLADNLDATLAGRVASADPFYVRAALAWQPTAGFSVAPWTAYSVADGLSAGLGSAFELDPLTARLDLERDWELGLTTMALSALGPRLPFAAGGLTLGAFWAVERSDAGATGNEAGARLAWQSETSAEGRLVLGLDAGWAWTDADARPLLRLKLETARRLSEAWGFDLALTYETGAAVWDEAALGLTRYFHCFYWRLGYDWVEDTVMVSGGIDF